MPFLNVLRRGALVAALGSACLVVTPASGADSDAYKKKKIDRAWLERYFEQQHELDPDALTKKQALYLFTAGNQPPYTIEQVLAFKKRGLTQSTPGLAAGLAPLDPGAGSAGKGSPGQTAAPKLPRWEFKGMLLRSSVEDVLASEDVTGASDIASTKKLTGAKFSYTRKFRSNIDSWSADGAVLFPFGYENPQGVGSTPVLTSAYVLPSMTFKRVTGGDKDDANSLAFRLGMAWTWSGGGIGTKGYRIFTGYDPSNNQYPATSYSQTLSLNAALETDFGGRRKIPAVELKWIPAFDLDLAPGVPLAIGHFRTLLNDKLKLDYRLEFSFQAEAGRRLEDEEDPKRDFTFFRAGPKAGITLDPFLHKDVRIGATYQWLNAFVGPREKQHHVTAFAQYRLSDAVHLSLDYEEGGTDLSKKPIKQLTLGLRFAGSFFAPKPK